MATQDSKKLFYKIGEVCTLTDTQPYVLRFWESEFPQLAPRKGRTGQRLYRERDIELVREIKKLLYEEGYTIAGARKQLGMDGETPPPHGVIPVDDAPPQTIALLEVQESIRSSLHEILDLMSATDRTLDKKS